MSTFKRQAIFFSGTALVFAPFAYADTANQPTETMVVTAAGYEQVQTDAPASVTLITQEELSSKYYRDVTDALTSVPGVVVTGGGDNKDISIRGMGSQYTLMLVDGKRLSSRQTRPNSDGPGIEAAWLPPLEAIERIEVIRGPMSTLYGSDAMGGVINIITKKSDLEWTGNVQLSTVLQENRDSGDEQNVNFFVTGPLTDALSLQVYGQNIHRDEDNIENGYQNKILRSLGSKLNYQINDQQDLSFTVETTKQERRSTDGLSVDPNGRSGAGTNQYNRTAFSVGHVGRWDDIGQSDSHIQYERNDNKSRQMSLENTVAKSTLVMPFEVNTLSVGIQGEYSKLEDLTSNRASTIKELSSSQGALFVEDEWRALDSFAITAGGRLDINEDFGSHFSPRLYGVWSINQAWTLKGGVSTGFKAPLLRQTKENWAQVSRGGNLYGNPDITPEKMVSEEINLIYNADSGLQASLGLFNNDFEDKITSIECTVSACDGDTGNRPARQYINVDEAVTRGVEASVDTPIGENWNWAASYTYTYSKQLSGDMEGSPLTQLPKHLFSTQLDWQTTELLNSWAKVTYRGKESDPSSFRETNIAPSYTFVDAGVTYQVTDNARVKAAIYNLLDEDVNYEEYGYIEDGRRYWLGLDVNF